MCIGYDFADDSAEAAEGRGVPLVTRLNADVENVDPLVPLTLERSFDLVAELLERLEKKALRM